jgi:hypothetical protein
MNDRRHQLLVRALPLGLLLLTASTLLLLTAVLVPQRM